MVVRVVGVVEVVEVVEVMKKKIISSLRAGTIGGTTGTTRKKFVFSPKTTLGAAAERRSDVKVREDSQNVCSSHGNDTTNGVVWGRFVKALT